MLVRLVLATLLFSTLPRSAFADDETDDTEVTHYYHLTLAADAVGIATLVAGGLAEGPNGRDTQASNALFTTGALVMGFGAPLIHLARGHGDRAVGSFLIRSAAAGAGMAVAVAANTCNEDKEFLCKMDYLGYGFLGGLAVASVIDAAFLTEERVPKSGHAWTPTVAASSDGARIGFAAVF